MASEVVTKIQFRRGPEAERTQIVPHIGEPILSLTADGKKFFVGDGTEAGGLGIPDLCYNENFSGDQEIPTSFGMIKTKNGIIVGYQSNTRIKPVSDHPGVKTDKYSSSSQQYVNEEFVTVKSLGKQYGVNVLKRASRFNGGVLTGILNGPGIVLQHLADGNVYPEDNIDDSSPNVTYEYTSSTTTSTGDDFTEAPMTFEWKFSRDGRAVSKDAVGVYWRAARAGRSSIATREWSLGIWATAGAPVRDSEWMEPQQSQNDGLWIYLDQRASEVSSDGVKHDIKQWAWTSMSIWPWVYLTRTATAVARGPGNISGATDLGDWVYFLPTNNSRFTGTTDRRPLIIYSTTNNNWINIDDNTILATNDAPDGPDVNPDSTNDPDIDKRKTPS
jgi:hypothetical protein